HWQGKNRTVDQFGQQRKHNDANRNRENRKLDAGMMLQENRLKRQCHSDLTGARRGFQPTAGKLNA
ncbi:MAG: hypothetical protein AAGF28_13625, partial [Pseudomonadota bacterium]